MTNLKQITEFSVATGQTSGWLKFRINADRPSVSISVFETLWCGTAANPPRFPVSEGAQTVRVKALGHVDDDAAGDGARAVTITGLKSDFTIASEVLVTAGASASAASANSYWFIFRSRVTADGSERVALEGTNRGEIIIEGTGASNAEVDCILQFAGVGTNSTFAVPDNFIMSFGDITVNPEGSKGVDIDFYAKDNFDSTSAPFGGTRRFPVARNAQSEIVLPASHFPEFTARTHIWFAAKTNSGAAADVSLNAQIILRPVPTA